MIPVRLRTAGIAVCVGAFLFSCTFDYTEGEVEAADGTGIPQVEILSARMVVVRENRLELDAERIASYPDEQIQLFETVVFREFGRDGQLRFEGRADEARLYLGTEDIELSGSVRIVSFIEEGVLESDYLYWENDRRILENSESDVVISRENGTTIEGRGLYVDGRRNVIEYRDGVSGVYYNRDQ